ncbi:heme peroxidase [Mycena epipterygia]|nr:heme peroxidase [Mycena epipterygia]
MIDGTALRLDVKNKSDPQLLLLSNHFLVQNATSCLASTVHLVLGAAVFNWLDPLLDTLDDQLYRPGFNPASTFALNCGPHDNSTIAAQWLRLAYHDMATHNSTTGTGGMDASIVFEFDRPQDIGVGMLESLVDFLVAPNEYVGMADVIAMGAINAVVGCGGPIIPFRGGRIDATEAGPATARTTTRSRIAHRIVAKGRRTPKPQRLNRSIIVAPAGGERGREEAGYSHLALHVMIVVWTDQIIIRKAAPPRLFKWSNTEMKRFWAVSVGGTIGECRFLRIVMLLAWLQAAKPWLDKPSQAKSLASGGLVLGLGVTEAQATGSSRGLEGEK